MSTNKELKKMLMSSLQMEEELFSFCTECLKELYTGKDRDAAVWAFEESYEGFEQNGCLMGLGYIQNQVEVNRENRRAREALKEGAL